MVSYVCERLNERLWSLWADFPSNAGCSTDPYVGSGKDRRQKQIVQGRITNGTLFPNISVRISDNINSAVADAEKRLRQIVRQSMAAIQNDFDLTIAPPPNNGNTQPDHNEERSADAQERRALVEQTQSFKGRHASLLEGFASDW